MYKNKLLLDLPGKHEKPSVQTVLLSKQGVGVLLKPKTSPLSYLLFSACAFFLLAASDANSGMCVVHTPIDPPSSAMSDLFDGNGPLVDYTTNNASALPDVVRKDGRYHATLTNNSDNITLHFNQTQGRLDAKRLSFPFEFIARNIGIGTLADSQVAPAPNEFPSPSNLYMFAGIQVHVLDLDSRNSAHFVVGHRGSTSYTVEGKNTFNGISSVNDAGQGVVPSGRADLRVVGNADRSLSWYWQQPNFFPALHTDDWIAYRGNGVFPGGQAQFGDEVYIGMITYAYGGSSVPFVGTADSIEWDSDAP